MEIGESQQSADGGESASEDELLLMRRYRAIGMTARGPEVCKRNQKLVEVVPRLSAALEKALRKQHTDFQRLDLAELERGWEQLEEARQRDVQMAALTTVNIPDEDADFAKVRQMETELSWYMTQAVRLHHLCQAYHTEAEDWRRRVATLESEKEVLLRQTFTAKTENELVAAAAEQLDPSEDLAACVFLRKQRPGRRAAKRSSGSLLQPVQPPLQPRQSLQPPVGAPPVSARSGRLATPLESLVPSQAASASVSARATRSLVSPPARVRPHDPAEAPPVCTLQPGLVPKLLEDALVARRTSEASRSARSAEVEREENREQRSESEYLAEIKLLESRLQRVKESVQQKRDRQRAAAQLVMGHKEDMERFFLLCMHDLRGELHRRNGAASAREACPWRHPQDLRHGRQPFQGKNIVDLVAGSDHVLNALYETLFPHRLAASRQHAWDASQSRAFPKTQSNYAAAADSLLHASDAVESRSLD